MARKKSFLISCFAWALAFSAHADVSFGLVGDVMLGNVLTGAVEADKRFLNVKPYFSGLDFGFANLEGPIGGSPQEGKVCSGSSNCHKFSQPSDTAAVLAGSGVNIVSVANNHASDTGVSGRNQTLQTLYSSGIMAAGSSWEPVVMNVRGLRVGFLAFSVNKGLPDWRGNEGLQAVRTAKGKSDILVISVHAGCEGETQHVVRDSEELCFGENRGNIVRFAYQALDLGADMIVGHGPHVPRGHEIRNGKLILWSLGNFMTAQGISISGLTGVAPLARVLLSDDGRVKQWDVISFRQDRTKGIFLDPAKTAESMVYRKMP